MQMRSLAKVAVVAVLGLSAATADAREEKEEVVDQKALPGSICVPANLGQAREFRYKSGEIRNVGDETRNVECPILRDGFFGGDGSGGDGRVEEINVFIKQPNRGKTSCTVSVTDVRTGDDQRSRSGSGPRSGKRSAARLTRSTSKSGDRRLIFSGLKLNEVSIIHLRCKVPPQGRIRGILWEERLETDLDEGFGPVKGS